jgi:hypothetical protein
MKNIKYILASTLIIISAGLFAISYWDVITEPHIVDRIVTIFSVLSLTGLGVIVLKRYNWMKWVLLLIILFEIPNLIEVIRFRSELTLILTVIQCALIISAMILLFLIKDLKEQE